MTYKVIQTAYPHSNGGKANCDMVLGIAMNINAAYKMLEEFVSKWLDYEFVVREEKK